ncbi:MAG: histidine phosphatase family protein [Anaerolineae bacterium]
MAETKSYDFVFLRHGESVGNAEERFQGQTEYPLTDRGRRQAQALADRWQKEGMRLDLAIASPLSRARETATIVANTLDIPLELDPIWMERNAGEIAGLTREETMKRYPHADLRTPYDPFGDSGEGDWELFLRAGTAVHRLLKRPPGKYLIVTHGGMLNKVMYAVLGIPVQPHFNGPSFRFGNTGFAMFRYNAARHQWRFMRLESPV